MVHAVIIFLCSLEKGAVAAVIDWHVLLLPSVFRDIRAGALVKDALTYPVPLPLRYQYPGVHCISNELIVAWSLARTLPVSFLVTIHLHF